MDPRDEHLDEVNPIADRNARNSRIISDDDDPSLLVRTEVRPGRLPGNERVRLVRPSHSSFRRISNGLLEATNIVEEPHSNFDRVRRFLIVAPIASSRAQYQRLTKFKALPALSSHPISSLPSPSHPL